MSIAAPPLSPYKNRRGWAITFGIFEILIGCVVLLFLAFIFVAMRMAPPNASAPALDTRFLVMTAVFYGAIACFFVVVGTANVQIKRWARLAMLVVSWAWLVLGVLSSAMMAVMLPMIMSSARQNSTQAVPQNFDAIFRYVMLGILGVFFILLPLAFVLFYSAKNVKATYENAAGTAAPWPHKPVPVLIATGWFAISVPCYLYVLATPFLPLFGMLLRGWQAILVAAILAGINIWLAVNFYRQRAIAWKVAIPVIAFGWLSLLVTVSRMGTAGMYRAMGYTEAQTAQMVPMMTYILAMCSIVAIAFIVMLVVTRKHYHAGPAGWEPPQEV